jgi:hypothetical protein
MYLLDKLEFTYCLSHIPPYRCVANVGIVVSGAADLECQYHFFETNSAWDDENKAEQMGKALHFTQDCAVPLQTGAIYEQIGLTTVIDKILNGEDSVSANGCVDKEYENWISNNTDDFFGIGSNYYDGIRDAEWYGPAADQVNTVAGLSSLASDDVFETTYGTGEDNVEEWSDKLKPQTEACMYWAGKADAALVEKIW